MSDEIRIRVDWIPPVTMNVNAHKHWRRKHPDEQSAHALGYHATRDVLNDGAVTIPDHPVMVAIIHWPKGRKKRDADNALGSVKWICDGVCKALGIDDRRFLTSMAFQRRDKSGDGFTEIIIRPATADERRMAA